MEIGPVTRSTTDAVQGTQVSGDFEAFLRMLTVQMTNQDPLDPIKSEDYAVQLATFAGVEQQVQTNNLLRDLVSGIGSDQLSRMGNWIGMEGRAPVAGAFDGSSEVALVLPAASGGNRHELVVTDTSGAVVDRRPVNGAGGHYLWDGIPPETSAALPAGRYSFTVSTFEGEHQIGSAPVDVYGEIVEVSIGESGPEMVLEGGVRVGVDELSGLRRPEAVE
ncbi:flagellar hook capping FlgD N-terminal domain-containing protein [Tranquillimonas alkanivorans]|uniref:Basal-body rod modification protein FlgD n=1 Tax=Tranquillimonas alkanivorans TaxID=441119 RepID=A0A1I5LK16_9RHOB|nr:flagellar hook capping FlgD N-terminal domain-containing protein [Tranquillimonas alkanivorans]SFO97630.1 flagellar basal-body rod modification protein FlgD [Tranquillimonas alkanivorans]